MTHRIVVLGAGYAGLVTAVRLARQTRHARVTLVNLRRHFVERVRLHQIAAGQRPPEYDLAGSLRGTGVELAIGRVRSLDLERRTVGVDSHSIGYDTLVYTLGSTADLGTVTGVTEHAATVATLGGARALRDRVAGLAAKQGSLVVVGGGATGIEAATELAESHPELDVRLVTGGEPGGWLSRRGRAHLRRAFTRLGIAVHAHTEVEEVREDAVVLAGGGTIGAGLTVWATGFRVPDLAARAGLAVDGDGRVLVDATARSLSHQDVYAVGDSAAARRPNGQELRMSCAAALPAGMCAADAIAARLAGRVPRPLRFRYHFQCLSLGRRDGLIQFLHPDDSPRAAVLTGRAAAGVKETVVRGALWTTRRPGPHLSARVDTREARRSRTEEPTDEWAGH